VLTPPVGRGDPVEQFDQILDEDHHLVRLLTLRARDGRRRVQHMHLHGLLPAASLDDAELHPLTRLERRDAAG
jgi:hypothetical protein